MSLEIDGVSGIIKNTTSDGDITIKGNDGGSEISALTFDISAAGAATFNNKIVATELDISGNVDVDGTTNLDVVDIDGALTQDGGAVFNEASADVDFRVESNGNANMLFVDGGNDRVGIGGTGASYGQIGIENAGDAQVDLFSNVGSGTEGKAEIFFSTDTGTDHLSCASIVMEQDGASSRKGQIRFLVSDNGGPATAATIASNKNVTFAAGLLIGGTGAANTLDDYEEGTWTPVIKSNNNTISRSGGNEFHTYTKIGRMVNITFTLQAVTLSGTIDNSGDFTTITGLPFTSSSTAGQRSPSTEILFFTSGSKFTEGNVTGTVGVNASKVEVLEHDGAGTGYSSGRIANLTSNTYWMFNLTYYV